MSTPTAPRIKTFRVEFQDGPRVYCAEVEGYDREAVLAAWTRDNPGKEVRACDEREGG